MAIMTVLMAVLMSTDRANSRMAFHIGESAAQSAILDSSLSVSAARKHLHR